MQQFGMRPMGTGDILDRTFKLYRGSFKTYALFALLIGGIASLITALPGLSMYSLDVRSGWDVIYSIIANGEDPETALYSLLNTDMMGAQATALSMVSSILSFFETVFITPLVMGGITLVTLSLCHGEQDSPKGLLSRTGKVYGKLFGTMWAMILMGVLVYFVLVILGVILIFAAIAIDSPVAILVVAPFVLIVICAALICGVAASLVYPVAVLEKSYGFKPIWRAFSLFFKKFWKCIGITLLAGILVSVLSGIIGMLLMFLPGFLAVLGNVALSALLMPIPVIITTLLYLDIRMRVEGYDMQVRNEGMYAAEIAEDYHDGSTY